jgi:hypothetical protein
VDIHILELDESRILEMDLSRGQQLECVVAVAIPGAVGAPVLRCGYCVAGLEGD